MGMFDPPFTYYNKPSQYELIGGAYYLPGTAAYNKAKSQAPLYAQPAVTPTSQAASIIAPYAPKAGAPTTFPSYSGGGMGGGSVLPGAPGRTGQGAFGLVPQVPNPIATAGQGIAGNIGNLPSLGNLGTETTKLAGNLAAMPFQQNLPGYEGMLGQSSQGILSNLQGIIDPNEWAQLQTKMAERGATMGISPGSPNFNTALMRALDQSILQRQSLGQQQLNAAVARTPTGQPFNIAGQQITPGTMQEAAWGANVAAAAPDPTMAAQANLDMLLRSIEAGRAGGFGGYGAPGGGGMGGGNRYVPVMAPGAGGYGGMPFYGDGQPTAPGWSGIVQQPYYNYPGLSEQNPAPWSGIGNVDVNSGENIPSSPYEYDYTYQPEPDIFNPYEYDYTYQPEGVYD